ncbi:hypothetical protein JYK22_27455, partial [Nonomuraea sp. RK-328]|nr:hypothetical protein [Nonomuraea sp. RK-328]
VFDHLRVRADGLLDGEGRGRGEAQQPPGHLVGPTTRARATRVRPPGASPGEAPARLTWSKTAVAWVKRDSGRLAPSAVRTSVTFPGEVANSPARTVAGSPGSATVSLVVETGGPVLDPDRVARLGRPFQRLAADRTGSGTGSGLGLSIVAAIAEEHGGRLDLRARPGGGLRVAVSLPADEGGAA